MKFISDFLLILLITLISLNLYAFDKIDTQGYFRLGGGWSEHGTQQSCFRLQNTPGYGPFRLGNECGGLYSELNLSMSKGSMDDSTKPWFSTNIMFAFTSDLLNTWEPTDSGDLVISLRQFYSQLGNILSLGGIIWMGKRYYKRSDIHIFDLFLNENNGGRGFGFESLQVGNGKLHLALVQFKSEKKVAIQEGVEVSPPLENIFDIRYNLSNLDFNLIWGQVSSKASEGDGDANDYFKTQEGQTFVASYQANVSKQRSNKSFLQVSRGIYGPDFDSGNNFFRFGSGASALARSENDLKNKIEKSQSLRLSNQHVFSGNSLDYGISLVFQDDNFGGRKLSDGSNAKNRSILMLGVRSSYYLNNNWKATVDAGRSQIQNNTVKVDDAYIQANQSLNKYTLALEVVTQKGYWSRPSMRFFVSSSDWSNKAKGSVNGTLEHQKIKTSSLTYGFQTEYWW